jgi:hypothetical protein|nr:MAG TPA: hypothetical protein [Caudoviricetes sp.]
MKGLVYELMEYQLISPRNKKYTAIEQVLINRGIAP